MRNAVCDSSRAAVVGGILYAGLTASSLATFGAGFAIAAAGALTYANFCNAPLPPEARPRRPFRGGQCPGVRYNVPIYYMYRDNVNGSTGRQGGTFQVWGPITRAELFIDESQFNTTFFIVDGSQDDDVYALANEGFEIGDNMPRYDFIPEPVVCTPIDGSPDLCGDPPILPPPIPPGENPHPDNITYINNEGDTINVPITIRLGLPRFDVDATINVPVDLRFDLDPTLNVEGTLNIGTGNFTINVGGGRTPGADGPPGPGDVIPPGPLPPPPIDVPIDPPEPPEDPAREPEKIIRAVIVSCYEAATEATVIFQDENPDIYAPSLGSIQFLCRIAGGYAWTSDQPVKNKRNLIICPWQYGAVDVRGTARPGATFDLDPIYDIISAIPRYPT